MTSDKPPWLTSFVQEHQRGPSVKKDGIVAWLKHEIEYLENIDGRSSWGDGALSALKTTLRQFGDEP